MLLAGASSLLATDPAVAEDAKMGVPAPQKDPMLGVSLVLAGCVAQGLQYVFEEKVMAVDDVPPLVVIGMEGLWGVALTLFVVYPVCYMLPGEDNGSFEDPWDAIRMISNSGMLQVRKRKTIQKSKIVLLPCHT